MTAAFCDFRVLSSLSLQQPSIRCLVYHKYTFLIPFVYHYINNNLFIKAISLRPQSNCCTQPYCLGLFSDKIESNALNQNKFYRYIFGTRLRLKLKFFANRRVKDYQRLPSIWRSNMYHNHQLDKKWKVWVVSDIGGG